jgi:hypothetical protein
MVTIQGGQKMVKLRLLVGLCAVLAPVVLASTATADPFVGPPICSSAGKAISGTDGSLTITGNAYVASGTTLTVKGSLTLARGACLDAFTLGTVNVGGNVLVSKGAILALGCSPGSIGPFPPCGTTTTSDTVGGSIVASQPLTMYLDGDTINGSVTSAGGGPGPTLNPYINFPIKENLIGGNLTVSGWQGAWFGVLRNTVHGNVTLSQNVGVTIGELGTLDSTEIVTNTISGNLTCAGNSPAAQFGDSGGAPNVVGGRKIGQCTAV